MLPFCAGTSVCFSRGLASYGAARVSVLVGVNSSQLSDWSFYISPGAGEHGEFPADACLYLCRLYCRAAGSLVLLISSLSNTLSNARVPSRALHSPIQCLYLVRSFFGARADVGAHHHASSARYTMAGVSRSVRSQRAHVIYIVCVFSRDYV